MAALCGKENDPKGSKWNEKKITEGVSRGGALKKHKSAVGRASVKKGVLRLHTTHHTFCKSGKVWDKSV